MAWSFYVYRLIDGSGITKYIGKGSGRRMYASARRFGLRAEEVARFMRECDAYQFERSQIAEISPALNKHPGGNGCRVKRRAKRLSDWERICADMGTRVVAARLWLAFAPRVFGSDLSKVEAIRRVAYGDRG